MKRFQNLLTFSLILFAFVSFAQNTETRNLSQFSKLRLEGAANISLTQGNSNSITIETKKIATDAITTEVKNGTLVISMKKGKYKNTKIQIDLTFTNLEGLELLGAGNITGKNVIKCNEFKLVSKGAGNVNLKLDTQKLDLTSQGAGNITLKGNATNQKIDSKGAGNINAYDLKGTDVKATLAGVGNIHVYASKSIEGSLRGVGNIRYKGNPNNVQVSENGLGNVKKAN